MLSLLKNTTFLTAVHRASDIIKNVRTNFETSDTQLLDKKHQRKNLCRTEGLEITLEKKSRSTRNIVIKLPVKQNAFQRKRSNFNMMTSVKISEFYLARGIGLS